MDKRRTLAVVSALFAAVSTTLALTGMAYGAAGFAIASGLAGLFARWSA